MSAWIAGNDTTRSPNPNDTGATKTRAMGGDDLPQRSA